MCIMPPLPPCPLQATTAIALKEFMDFESISIWQVNSKIVPWLKMAGKSESNADLFACLVNLSLQ